VKLLAQRASHPRAGRDPNDDRAHVFDLTARFRLSFASVLGPPGSEGAGKAGRWMHPLSTVCDV